mmetsp:Transcript_22458/g.19406  ORF Transcript_22458/g.19406 Transcript_22458/m.19406 type:complete len:109 (-) Transcript_22458:1671-1997(-)
MYDVSERKKKISRNMEDATENDIDGRDAYKLKIRNLKMKLLKAQEKLNKGEFDASRNILYGESSAESSDSEFGELGQRKTCKSTRMSFEAEDYVDFDDFPIVFYEPKA